LQVVGEDGAELGVLNDVYELPANDVYQIVRDGKELLIPAIEGVILGIQMDKRVMTVRLPEGLSDTDL
jgi:16S rRNA processing protein RimM